MHSTCLWRLLPSGLPVVMHGGTGKKVSSSGAVHGGRGYRNAKQPVLDEFEFGKQAAQTVSRMHEQVDRHTCAQSTHLHKACFCAWQVTRLGSVTMRLEQCISATADDLRLLVPDLLS